MIWDGSEILSSEIEILSRVENFSEGKIEKWKIRVENQKEFVFAKKINVLKNGARFPCFFEELKRILKLPYIETRSIFLRTEGVFLLFPCYTEDYKPFDLESERTENQTKTLKKIFAMNEIFQTSLSRKFFLADFDGKIRIVCPVLTSKNGLPRNLLETLFENKFENLNEEIQKIVSKIDPISFRQKAFDLIRQKKLIGEDEFNNYIEELFSRILYLKNL